MSASITALILFAGAGGWNTGFTACGVPILAALNHSERSLATHTLNFPQIRQVLTDITQDDPRLYPHATILQASPECRYQSTAIGMKLLGQNQPELWPELRGQWTDREEDDPATRSRVTMNEVVKWADAKKKQGHPFKLIFVENVPEVERWGGYQAWLDNMKRLEYRAQILYFNSMFAPAFPAPCYESRDRWYAVFSLDGVPTPDLDIRPPAYCKQCDRRVGALQSWKSLKRWGGVWRTVCLRMPRMRQRGGPLLPSGKRGAELGASNSTNWHAQKNRWWRKPTRKSGRVLRAIAITPHF